jgi:SpoVK/Ycf46/Vps4 family AAA+-type ATPase
VIIFYFVCFLFSGTGKTTVAKCMGKLFQSLGLLASGEVVEVSVSKLSTQFSGQAAKQTRKKFEEARGGVLFIDEAYRLLDDVFSAEIVGEIVQLLTEDDFKGKMVVIFAGYEEPIRQLMKMNEGLSSRVTETIHFDKFDSQAVVELLTIKLKKHNKLISPDITSAQLDTMAGELVNLSDFASGRDIETWSCRIVRECAMGKTKTVTSDILRRSLDIILVDRKPMQTSGVAGRVGGGGGGGGGVASTASQYQKPMHFSTAIDVKFIEKSETEKEVEVEGGGGKSDEELIADALQKTCVELGYDASLEKRKELETILLNVEKGGKFPADIFNSVRKKIPQNVTDLKISKALIPQVKPLRLAVEAAIKFELAQIAELERMNELERQKEVKKQAEIQTKLMGICPAGFQWHREDHGETKGWRCGGGAHWVPENQVYL